MYVQLYSVHGLIRGEQVEMGRDADTGGQVRYVLELARCLAKMPQIDQVDLFTRRIKDKRVSDDYAQEIEPLGENCRLVRIACGGGRYLRKERLWPHLDEFVDGAVRFTRREGQAPTFVHGHYADAGYVGRHVAETFGTPFVFTGHSLGIPKLQYLLKEGWTEEKARDVLAIDRRIAEEQECLDHADLVITSTRHELETQYGQYKLPKDLRIEVIPPGTDLERFFPHYDYDLPGKEIDERFKQARFRMQQSLRRFYVEPEKPMILAVCRPDRRKNIQALVKTYGESGELKAIANLAIFAGIRSDIESMPENEQQVLTDMLLLMDRYDLYGKMAIPKNHDSEFDVPELYRLAASSGGVFANTAFIELFGLTAIEAAATGLPFVATEDGGPTDIVANTNSGIAVNVGDQEALTSALLDLLTDRERWNEMSSNGINRVREHYAWQTHCNHYLEQVEEILQEGGRRAENSAQVGRRRMIEPQHWVISDIDHTLLGDDEALRQLQETLRQRRQQIGFGVASGRAPELIRRVLEESEWGSVDLMIASVGTEIYYGLNGPPDRGWEQRLRKYWKRETIVEALEPLDFLELQQEEFSQGAFKVSYHLRGEMSEKEARRRIEEAIAPTKVQATVVISHDTLVDVLPRSASKGKAIRYLAQKWELDPAQVITAGDSGNDRDMLLGYGNGIIVGNHTSELQSLAEQGGASIYYASGHHAAGILEGMVHFGVIDAEVAHHAASA